MKLDATLLRDTSRSFYRTLSLLPSAVRPQISLAYLLARTTDTIADTDLVSPEQRLEALRNLRARIVGANWNQLDFGELARQQGTPAERRLLEECETSLSLLERLSAEDQKLVRDVLTTIISGQELDLTRFAAASAENILALHSAADLDDYTYRVAGCVGEFWTRICRAHVFPNRAPDENWLLEQGVRFGKGLQLVNILRDMPRDLRQGRCYLPAVELYNSGLKPADLLLPANEPKLRPVYNSWLDRAREHLRAGWAYTLALPWTCIRVRLACAFPIIIGVDTLKLLRSGNVLDPAQRIKITRSAVKRIMAKSVLFYPVPGLWRGLGEP